MTKLLIGLLCAGAVATAGWAATASIGDAEPARTVSIPQVTTAGDDDAAAPAPATTTRVTSAGRENEVEDVSGPCDETEHANDPRCTGAGAATTRGDDRDDDDGPAAVENEVEDVSGPCDEAEHANDPRCTGGTTAGDDRDDDGGEDHGGRGRGGGDRSGSNSGKG